LCFWLIEGNWFKEQCAVLLTSEVLEGMRGEYFLFHFFSTRHVVLRERECLVQRSLAVMRAGAGEGGSGDLCGFVNMC